MGAANAFLSPILLAALSEVVAPNVLGRSVGTFAAWQTAGFTFAPAIGGLLGEASWRFAFAVVAVPALALALPRRTLGSFEHSESRLARALLNRWIALLSAKASLGYLGFTAIGFVLVLVAAEEFNLGSGTRGLLVAGYGVGGDRARTLRRDGYRPAGRPRPPSPALWRARRSFLALAYAPSAWSLALIWFAVRCAGTFVWAGLNTITVESFPRNRAGATSAYCAFKFAGSRSRRSSTCRSSTTTPGAVRPRVRLHKSPRRC